MVTVKWSIFINFQFKKYFLIQIQKNQPILDLQKPTIYQINGNFISILMNLSDLSWLVLVKEIFQFHHVHFLCIFDL